MKNKNTSISKRIENSIKKVTNDIFAFTSAFAVHRAINKDYVSSKVKNLLDLSKMKMRIVPVLNTLLFMLTAHASLAQEDVSIRSIDSLEWTTKITQLRNEHGNNKSIEPSLELATLVALEFVQNLDSTRVKVKFASIGTSLNARPTVFSLIFRKRTKRQYVIRVNGKSKGKIPLVQHANFNATVGVIGHELSHIQDYSLRSFGGVMKRLFAYGSKKGKEKYEKEIDSLTIWSGLGWQAADWERFVQNSPIATDEYKAFKREIYYESKEIEMLIEQYEKSLMD